MPVRMDKLRVELDAMLHQATSGEIWTDAKFADTPDPMRRVHDIAFSGDGEPTTCPRFEEAVDTAIAARAAAGLDAAKLILITNATMLDRPRVRRALAALDAAGRGEVWAKLDAGTQDYYQWVDRSRVPLEKVLRNILACGHDRPVTIQTMLMQMRGESMPDTEFDAYVDRLIELREAGAQLTHVQLYTVARTPAEKWVSPLSCERLDAFADRLRRRLPDLPCSTHHAPAD